MLFSDLYSTVATSPSPQSPPLRGAPRFLSMPDVGSRAAPRLLHGPSDGPSRPPAPKMLVLYDLSMDQELRI